MKITLTPDTEAIVNDAMASGLYVSRSEVVREALRYVIYTGRMKSMAPSSPIESEEDDSAANTEQG